MCVHHDSALRKKLLAKGSILVAEYWYGGPVQNMATYIILTKNVFEFLYPSKILMQFRKYTFGEQATPLLITQRLPIADSDTLADLATSRKPNKWQEIWPETWPETPKWVF